MKYSNEFLLPHTLSDLQHQVMIGGLLGDSCLQKEGKFPRMKIDRQAIDKLYIDWQYSIFKELCLSGVREFSRFDKRYDKWHQYVSFRTRAVPAFLNYYNEWYKSGTRQVPENIEFTPIILAVWFADDGCIINERKQESLTLKISTESFGKAGAELLSSKLESRFGESFPIYRKKKNKDQFFIKTSTIAAHAFIKDIQAHIIDMGMLRKYDIWKGCNVDYTPINGRQPIIDKELEQLFLSLKDFSLDQITYLYPERQEHNSYYVNRCFRFGYLDRYTSSDKFNVYRYILTDLGKVHFNTHSK